MDEHNGDLWGKLGITYHIELLGIDIIDIIDPRFELAIVGQYHDYIEM